MEIVPNKEEVKVFHIKRGFRLLAWFFVITYSGFLLAGVLIPWHDPSFPNDQARLVIQILWFGTFGMMLLGSVCLVLSVWKNHASVSAVEIVMHSFWGDRRMRWDEIEKVEWLGHSRGIRLMGPQKMTVLTSTFGLSAIKEISAPARIKIPAERHHGWAEHIAVPEPMSEAKVEQLVLFLVGAFGAIGIIALLFDPQIGAVSLMGAAIGTWAAVRMRKWKMGLLTIVGWIIFGIWAWRFGTELGWIGR